MARPKGKKAGRLSLTVPLNTKRDGYRLARNCNLSLSQYISQLLDRKIAEEEQKAREDAA